MHLRLLQAPEPAEMGRKGSAGSQGWDDPSL
jgi:hypothetical protein